MMANLKPYLRIKDSGVLWLGEVSEHWRVQRLRNLAEMRVSSGDKERCRQIITTITPSRLRAFA